MYLSNYKFNIINWCLILTLVFFLSLVSISFGQSAIFLIGGKDKSVKPVPLLLESGDVLVLVHFYSSLYVTYFTLDIVLLHN